MSENDFKKTYNGFTKFVLYGDCCCHCYIGYISSYIALKSKNDSSSIKEDLASEKRVSITPETAKNLIGLGLKVCVEKNYANHLESQIMNIKKLVLRLKILLMKF